MPRLRPSAHPLRHIDAPHDPFGHAVDGQQRGKPIALDHHREVARILETLGRIRGNPETSPQIRGLETETFRIADPSIMGPGKNPQVS